MPKNVVIIGAGGHAKVIADIILCSGDKVIGFLDDNEEKQGQIIYKDIKVIGKVANYTKCKDDYFIIAIGDNHTRAKIAESLDVKYYTAIHPKSVVADTAKISEGTAIMAGSIINSDTQIGAHCIINTMSSVDHDNTINNFVHISPGVHLAGKVFVGEYTWICAGTTIINNINVCENVIVGAGSTVIKSIEHPGTYIGTPAQKMEVK